jgi:hypothetical protein
VKRAGFLIFHTSVANYRGGSRRGAERRVVLPGDVICWKRSRTGEHARGQVCEDTFTRGGRVRVVELDEAGEGVRETTVHPVKILGHVSDRIDLILERRCPGCGDDPKRCACPTWAPLPIAERAA